MVRRTGGRQQAVWPILGRRSRAQQGPLRSDCPRYLVAKVALCRSQGAASKAPEAVSWEEDAERGRRGIWGRRRGVDRPRLSLEAASMPASSRPRLPREQGAMSQEPGRTELGSLGASRLITGAADGAVVPSGAPPPPDARAETFRRKDAEVEGLG